MFREVVELERDVDKIQDAEDKIMVSANTALNSHTHVLCVGLLLLYANRYIEMEKLVYIQ